MGLVTEPASGVGELLWQLGELFMAHLVVLCLMPSFVPQGLRFGWCCEESRAECGAS